MPSNLKVIKLQFSSTNGDNGEPMKGTDGKPVCRAEQAPTGLSRPPFTLHLWVTYSSHVDSGVKTFPRHSSPPRASECDPIANRDFADAVR